MKFPAFTPINLIQPFSSVEAVDLNLTQIEPDENQPRKMFSATTLEELAQSIKNHGLIQPIIVKDIHNDGKRYQIIAGERRWRAAKIVGLVTIPAIIKKYDTANHLAISLIENIQRENLNPIEEAQAIQSLLDECYMTHSQVAENLGKSRTSVSNLLRLLSLSDKVKEMVNLKLLEMGHARALLSLSETQQVEMANLIAQRSLSVRATEKLVQRMNSPFQKKIIPKNEAFKDKAQIWKDDLLKSQSLKANIHTQSSGKGKLVLHFESLQEAEVLMKHISLVDLTKL